jgi:hypothetical protein
VAACGGAPAAAELRLGQGRRRGEGCGRCRGARALYIRWKRGSGGGGKAVGGEVIGGRPLMEAALGAVVEGGEGVEAARGGVAGALMRARWGEEAARGGWGGGAMRCPTAARERKEAAGG